MKKLTSIFILLFTLSQLAFGSLIRPQVSQKHGSSGSLVADSSKYQNAMLITGVAADIAITVGSGGLGAAGKLGTLGKVVRAYEFLDTAQGVGRGAYGYAQGDFSFNNTLSLLGGITGFRDI